MPFQSQVWLPVTYDGIEIDAALRLDLLVDDSVVVELKAVDRMLPVYESQLLSYLRLTNHRLGLLINFHVPLIRDGIARMAL